MLSHGDVPLLQKHIAKRHSPYCEIHNAKGVERINISPLTEMKNIDTERKLPIQPVAEPGIISICLQNLSTIILLSWLYFLSLLNIPCIC